jgi:protein-S-isoprenylcysteine O-methyltransferase Ste14
MSLATILKSRFWPAIWQLFRRSYTPLGLPLLAWGLDDLPGFFSNQVRIGFAVAAITQALIFAWMVYVAPPQPKHESPIDMTHWQIDMFEFIFILAAFGDRRNILTWTENLPLRWAGLGIYLIGVMLSIWANLTWVNHLRREAEHAYTEYFLLIDGPYKFIRHPGLLCLIICSLGAALAYRSWTGLALLIPLTGGFIHRINNLEKNFAEQYRQAWPLRHHTSKRIFPFLY